MAGIIRIKKRPDRYVLVDKEFIDNPNISGKAKWIQIYLLSKPDDWKTIVGDIVKHCTEGESAVRSGLAELKRLGYHRHVRVTDPQTGRVKAWEIVVFETPELAKRANLDEPTLFDKVAENEAGPARRSAGKASNPRSRPDTPDCGFPDVEKPDVEKPDVENRRVLNNERASTDLPSNERTDEPPPLSAEEDPLAAVQCDTPVISDGHAVLALAHEGFEAADARQLVQQHGAEQIATAIANADAMKRRGTLKHRRRYIAAAIVKHYGPIDDGGRPASPKPLPSGPPPVDVQRADEQLQEQQAEDEDDRILSGLSDQEWQRHVSEMRPTLGSPVLAMLGKKHPRDLFVIRALVARRIRAELAARDDGRGTLVQVFHARIDGTRAPAMAVDVLARRHA